MICAAKRIFGDPKGVYLLYAYDKYGLHLSKYADVHADKDGFELDTVRAVMAAAQTTPVHLYGRALNGNKFYRYVRGHRPSFQEKNVMASADGAIYDRISRSDSGEKIYILTHEIGHRAGVEGYGDMSKSEEWLSISGFKVVDKKEVHFEDYEALEGRTSVSLYSNKSSEEDFAETYAMYRLAPHRLLRISPRRYYYMKDNVFNGLEYTSDLCLGAKTEGGHMLPLVPSDGGAAGPSSATQ